MHFRRTAVPAVLLTALALLLGACGNDYNADLVDDLKKEGASETEAKCFIDEVGEDKAKEFLKFDDAGPSGDDAEDTIAEYAAALDECGID